VEAQEGPAVQAQGGDLGPRGISRSAAAEVYEGEYQFQHVVENLCEPRFPNPLTRAHHCGFLCCFPPSCALLLHGAMAGSGNRRFGRDMVSSGTHFSQWQMVWVGDHVPGGRVDLQCGGPTWPPMSARSGANSDSLAVMTFRCSFRCSDDLSLHPWISRRLVLKLTSSFKIFSGNL
jgi:hypothetical protein